MSFWRSKDKSSEAGPAPTPPVNSLVTSSSPAPAASAPLFGMSDQRSPSVQPLQGLDPTAAALASPPASTPAPRPVAPERPEPSAGDTKAREALANQSAAAFGKITSVLMHCDPVNRHPLADLAWLVVPTIVNGTYSIAESRSQSSGPSRPAAVALWACVSDEVDRRLTDEIAKPLRLQPQDWKSGENYWLIQASGETRAVQKLVDHLMRTTFSGRHVKVRTEGPDGTPVAGTLAMAQPAPARSPAPAGVSASSGR